MKFFVEILIFRNFIVYKMLFVLKYDRIQILEKGCFLKECYPYKELG